MIRESGRSVAGIRRITSFAISLALGLLAVRAKACDFCETGQSPFGGVGPNTYWNLIDSLAVCPAGDSLSIGDVNARHPSKLRIEAWYEDINCNPKVGVPPESLWVTWSTLAGNAAINDEGAKIFADDSTDICGHTRFTIPSLSGCGKITVSLKISGKTIGSKNVVVRSVDVNADGRVDALNDLFQATCDVNYDGATGDDGQVENQHLIDWHRNALFGTLVRRTNACPTCPSTSSGTLGGDYSWGPTGKMLAVSIYDASHDCTINLVPADASVGSLPIRFTNPVSAHDYSPNWSPLGTPIYWNREDFDMMYKGVFGYTTDTTTYTIPITTTLGFMEEMSLSPDGRTLAFHGAFNNSQIRIFTVPIRGGTPFQVTPDTAVDDHFPQWSPDGSVIIFYRLFSNGPGNPQTARLYEVAAAGGTPRPVGAARIGEEASYHPNGGIMVYSSAPTPGGVLQTATLDTTLANGGRPIINYPDYSTQNLPLPKISPDGTRLAIRSYPPGHTTENKQLWVARRNMSSPPRFTSFGGQQLADTTVAVYVNPIEGLNYSATLSGTDSEGDPLTYLALFLRQDLGMSFEPSTHQFSWTPPIGTAGDTMIVRFVLTTPSGGTDLLTAQFAVRHAAPQFTLRQATDPIQRLRVVLERNYLEAVGDPSSGRLALDVFDIEGRHVASLATIRDGHVAWSFGRTSSVGVVSGVYFYRATQANQVLVGKFSVLR